MATAKRQVFGQVDIDMIAGPSEIGIIADDSANPVHLAADFCPKQNMIHELVPLWLQIVKT